MSGNVGELEVDPTWRRSQATATHITHTCAYCPETAYLSLAVPHSAAIEARETGNNTIPVIHRIIFTTESHDQGFSDRTDLLGTYERSYSFFEAHAVDPHSGSDRVPRRRIQYNLHGSDEYRTHVNVWDRRDETLASASPGAAVWSSKEESKGLGLVSWLDGIRGGDIIRLVPKAFFPGWKNTVKSARIDMWVEFVPLPSPRYSLPTHVEHVLYRQLQTWKKEIRLAVLEPFVSNQNNDSPVRISLQYASLLDPNHLSYEALSYCWGDADNDANVIQLVNPDFSDKSVEIPVRANLYSALKQLRSTAQRVLWIDLICINQADLEERAMQVGLMGEIFAFAKSVKVWIGEADDQVREDFAIIRSIGDAYSSATMRETTCKHKSESAGEGDRLCLPGVRETHERIAHETYYTVDVDCIFQRPWFQRAWVVQEVWSTKSPFGETGETQDEQLIQGRVSIHCGDEVLPWEILVQANRCLCDKAGFLNNYTMPRLLTNLFNVKRGIDSSRLTCMPAPRSDILSIIISGLDLQATDPRDKIYALLTFGEETHNISELPRLLGPDYTKDVTLVYADFTRWWILHHGSLRILSAVHTLEGKQWLTPPESTSISSDVEAMDVTSKQQNRASWSLWSVGHDNWAKGTLALYNGNTGYTACGDRTTADMKLLDVSTTRITAVGSGNERLKLKLRGVRLGSLADDPQFYPYYRQPPLPAGLQDAYTQLFDPPATMGTWLNSRNGGDGDLGDYERDYDKLVRHYIAHWGYFPPERSSVTASEEEEDDDAEAEGITYRQPDWLPCHGRCMFNTKDGKIGLCPSFASSGDIVAVLYGGKVPYILRATETVGEYTFVGECYVEDFMHGQAFNKDLAGEAVEEVFTLV
ncbi:hypothetical protein VHEMI01707 [[Torrubiella] hemipterigena]|uniref:Heterokaryon incompatibility domain-containing protein n=1 Tax=[Torrubiella] hemipterigena TaxID=1531966 RepID=A0A0A1T5L8_9HYPO|nr:hypothetical protein VHEMI01707 [[Torrubiella] hemipterigena]